MQNKHGTHSTGKQLPLLSLFLVLIAAPVAAQTLPGTYSNSWVGNTYGLPADHIAHTIDNLYVSPSGEVATVTGWDEGGHNAALYSSTGVKLGIPVGSGTGGWGRNSGQAIFVDDRYLYQAMNQNGRDGASKNPDQYPQDPRFVWTCIRRYNHDGTSAPFPGGKGYDGSMLVVDSGTSGKIPTGVVVLNNELYVSDPVAGQIKVYSASTMSANPLRSWPVENPGLLATDRTGFLWMLDTVQKKLIRFSTTGVLGSQVISFSAAVTPTSFCVDNVKDRILVTNNGADQNILIYTGITRKPAQTSTFGRTGGINSGTAGALAPLKFSEPKGVGVDAAGDIFVGNNAPAGGGARLEKYNSRGALQWRLNGLIFTANGDLNAAKPSEFYVHNFKFDLNLGSAAPGSQWSPAAMTVNKVKYPNDARLSSSPDNKFWTTAYSRTVSGHKLLYVSDMYGSGLAVYRFNAKSDGETAIPSGLFNFADKTESIWRDANDNGSKDAGETDSKTVDNPYSTHIFPDAHGGVWKANREQGIRYFPMQGFDVKGNPKYSYAASQAFVPTEIKDVKRLEYDAANDVLYAMGRTPDVGDAWWAGGDRLVRTNNALGARTLAWSIALPYSTAGSPSDDTNIKAFCEAGDYLFLIGAREGRIFVHLKSDGRKIGEIRPTAATGNESGWSDINGAIRATKLPGGEYLIFAEENGKGKIMMYRWNPTGIAAPAPAHPES